MTNLKIGQKAPELYGTDEQGNPISLSDYKGKKLVLYFYPKDDTPTCTTESCNLRDNYKRLKDLGIEILGVSADSAKRHQNFKAKYDLPFKLLVDDDKATINAYGVWGPKKFMGREFDGIHRLTFVIDEKGDLEAIITKVKAGEHTQQILDELNMGN